jgi:hypothetical protein
LQLTVLVPVITHIDSFVYAPSPQLVAGTRSVRVCCT